MKSRNDFLDEEDYCYYLFLCTVAVKLRNDFVEAVKQNNEIEVNNILNLISLSEIEPDMFVGELKNQNQFNTQNEYINYLRLYDAGITLRDGFITIQKNYLKDLQNKFSAMVKEKGRLSIPALNYRQRRWNFAQEDEKAMMNKMNITSKENLYAEFFTTGYLVREAESTFKNVSFNIKNVIHNEKIIEILNNPIIEDKFEEIANFLEKIIGLPV